jgi:hypothetical protein
LADLGARKDAEKSVELAALKADMQKIIDAVSAERDENLSNYTKVDIKDVQYFSIVSLLACCLAY